MTKLRQLWLLTALGAVAILAGGYFMLVSPKAGHASALRGETQTLVDANRALQSQIAQLNKQKKELPSKEAVLHEFADKIPGNPALPALIRSLSDVADAAGVELVSVTPSSPAFTKNVDAQGHPLLGNVPAPGGTVLASIPLALNVKGHYSNVTQFFAELEGLQRALKVSGFNVAGGTAGGTTTTGAPADPAQLTVTVNASVLMTTKAPVVARPAVAPASSSDATK